MWSVDTFVEISGMVIVNWRVVVVLLCLLDSAQPVIYLKYTNNYESFANNLT